MGGTRTTIGTGLAAVLLLGAAAACGGGGDGPGGTVGGSGESGAGIPGQDGGGPDAGGPDAGDPCALLEVSDVEQQFGDLGAITRAEGSVAHTCTWEVATDPMPGAVVVGVETVLSGQSTADFLAGAPELGGEQVVQPVEIQVPGVAAGDAFYDAGMGNVWIRFGDAVVSVTTWLELDAQDKQDRLVALALLAGQRL